MKRVKPIEVESENGNTPIVTVPKGFRILGVKVWKPTIGETLEGVYLGAKKRKAHTKGKDGKGDFTSYEIARKETGEVYAVSGSALEQRFAELKPDTKVFLVYNGKRRSDKGRMYHDYDVYAS